MVKLKREKYLPKAKLLGGVFIALIFLQITSSVVWGAINVAILPFKTEGDEDIAYLRPGIEKILCSRIALGEKIYVIDWSDTQDVLEKKTNELDRETIQSIGYHLDADYIITGVLRKRGGGLTIDGEVVFIKSNDPPADFSVDCERIDDVIRKASQLANDLRNKLIELQNQVGPQDSLSTDDTDEVFREERLSPGE